MLIFFFLLVFLSSGVSLSLLQCSIFQAFLLYSRCQRCTKCTRSLLTPKWLWYQNILRTPLKCESSTENQLSSLLFNWWFLGLRRRCRSWRRLRRRLRRRSSKSLVCRPSAHLNNVYLRLRLSPKFESILKFLADLPFCFYLCNNVAILSFCIHHAHVSLLYLTTAPSYVRRPFSTPQMATRPMTVSQPSLWRTIRLLSVSCFCIFVVLICVLSVSSCSLQVAWILFVVLSVHTPWWGACSLRFTTLSLFVIIVANIA